MALKLTVVSEHCGGMGPASSIVIGVGGGSIGRARDNDWILPDPQRYVSAHHARVQFRHGNFYLFDTSSNGVYLNGGGVPLGRAGGYALRDGDILSFGEYRIAVSLDNPAADGIEASSIFPVSAPPPDTANGHLDADLSLGELLLSEPVVLPATAQVAPPVRVSAVAPTPAPTPATAPLISDSGLLKFDRGAIDAPPDTSRPKIAVRRDARTAGEGGLESFCRGAGLDPTALGVDAQSRLLHAAGLLLREALVGIKDLWLAQHEIRAQLPLDFDRRETDGIELSSLSVEELLQRLIQGEESRGLDAVQWLRRTLSSARRHDIAVMRAMRSALAEYLTRLSPQTLGVLAPEGVDGGEIMTRFRSITDMPAGQLPQLYLEAFKRAFTSDFAANSIDRSTN